MLQTQNEVSVSMFTSNVIYVPLFSLFSYHKMAQLLYKKIRGKRYNSRLLWVPEEKHLFVRHRVNENRNKGEDWICYQTILRKKNKNDVNCSSALHIDSKGICRRKNVRNSHTNHNNHQSIFDDLISLNNIKDDCITAKKVYEGISTSFSALDIFTRELSK